jgi:hypothetical protein
MFGVAKRAPQTYVFIWMHWLARNEARSTWSVVGGNTEIGALAAAFANGDPFTVIDPVGKETIVSLGERPLCFRGSIMICSVAKELRD